jgi:hypothetical protein
MEEFYYMEGKRVLIVGEVREVHDSGDFWVSIADADNYSAQWVGKDSIVCTHADYAALLARAEAAELDTSVAYRTIQYWENANRLTQERANKILRQNRDIEQELGAVKLERDRLREALEGMLMVSTSQRTTIEEQADAIAIARAALNGGGE